MHFVHHIHCAVSLRQRCGTHAHVAIMARSQTASQKLQFLTKTCKKQQKTHTIENITPRIWLLIPDLCVRMCRKPAFSHVFKSKKCGFLQKVQLHNFVDFDFSKLVSILKKQIERQQLYITESINSYTNKRPHKHFTFVQIVCVSCANNRCSSNITYHSFFPTTMDPTLIWSQANTLLILRNNYFMRIWNSLRGVDFWSPRSNKNPTFVDIYKFIKSLKMCFLCNSKKDFEIWSL